MVAVRRTTDADVLVTEVVQGPHRGRTTLTRLLGTRTADEGAGLVGEAVHTTVTAERDDPGAVRITEGALAPPVTIVQFLLFVGQRLTHFPFCQWLSPPTSWCASIREW